MEIVDGSALEEVEYPGGFYREQSPVHLNYICALNGIQGPNLDAGFSYCELGCGTGETTACLASIHPDSQFVGIDLSPSHIDKAQALARSGGLTNTTFIQADIASFTTDRLPNFDFITLHGVYSWVPDEVQTAILRLLSSKLKPGGIAYISYNAMPGWSSVAPLQRFFMDQAPRLKGNPVEKAQATLAALQRLRDQGATYFRENPNAVAVLKRLEKADPRYLAHEYLSQCWKPQYFADVFDQMVAIGLEYVGEASIITNLPQHAVAPAFASQLAEIEDRRDQETHWDFIQNRFFRRDIYAKPAAEPTASKPSEALCKTLFSLISDPVQIPDTIEISSAPWVKLSTPWLDRLKVLIGYRVLSLGEILADEQLCKYDPSELIDGINLLAAGGYCLPCLSRETEPPDAPTKRIEIAPPLNRIRLERHDWSESGFCLISPVTGTGVSLNTLETAVLASLRHDRPLDWLETELAKRDMKMQSKDDERPLDAKDATRQALKVTLQEFQRYKLPKLAYFGAVVPA